MGARLRRDLETIAQNKKYGKDIDEAWSWLGAAEGKSFSDEAIAATRESINAEFKASPDPKLNDDKSEGDPEMQISKWVIAQAVSREGELRTQVCLDSPATAVAGDAATQQRLVGLPLLLWSVFGMKVFAVAVLAEFFLPAEGDGLPLSVDEAPSFRGWTPSFRR